MVAAIEINYLAEGDFPDPVHIASGFGRLGGTSWTIIQAMFQNGRAIATSDTVIVCRTDGQAKPLRAELIAGLTAKMVTPARRSEEHTSELQSLMRNSYAVFCLKKKKKTNKHTENTRNIQE